MHGTAYCHILDGRIRIKVPEVKGSHAMAGELERQLAKLNGVAHVKANSLTGYVLVLFDSQIISHYHVFAVIEDFNCLNRTACSVPAVGANMDIIQVRTPSIQRLPRAPDHIS